ncbi:beta-1,4-glucuronyltransferase 1-like [Planococcus citri]|uniref:beta-1,4-glucuronyltransferase 1-like n=1 Tax=Planococcus citri TaxID=170843 RepID=UPI0031F7CE22
MPAIGHANNLIKVKVSCECNESHDDEFDDFEDNPRTTKKETQVFNPNDDLPSSIIVQNEDSTTRLIPFVFLSIFMIWFTITFLIIVNPPTSHCNAYCDKRQFDLSTANENGEKALYKLEKHFEKFNELTSLFGRYFNASPDRINFALQDASLWFIVYYMIEDDDITEQDKIFIKKNYFEYLRPEKYAEIKTATMRITSFIPKSLHQMLGIKQSYESKISNYGIAKYYAEKKRLEEPNQEVILSSSRTSPNDKYLMYDKVAYGEKYAVISKISEVTLTTQSSLDRLTSFGFSASKWTGPISLAVYVNEPNEYCAFKKFLRYLKRCKSDIYDRTCFSLATPKETDLIENKTLSQCYQESISCSSSVNDILNIQIKKSTDTSKQYPQGPGYPQNTMRNLAKYNSLTSYHLMLDIDIIPSPKMSASLDKFFKDKPVFKNGLVIPTYEISKKAKFPANKAELVNLKRKGQAQPFHKDVFALNQNATDFAKWEKIHDTFDDVKIVYDVPKFHLCYEPFFVEHRSGPFYNESFIGYGFTRSSHAYEMYMKNGNFQVLSPVFTVQLGLQKVKEWSPERQKENTSNLLIFQEFIANFNNHNQTINHPTHHAAFNGIYG